MCQRIVPGDGALILIEHFFNARLADIDAGHRDFGGAGTDIKAGANLLAAIGQGRRGEKERKEEGNSRQCSRTHSDSGCQGDQRERAVTQAG